MGSWNYERFGHRAEASLLKSMEVGRVGRKSRASLARAAARALQQGNGLPLPKISQDDVTGPEHENITSYYEPALDRDVIVDTTPWVEVEFVDELVA